MATVAAIPRSCGLTVNVFSGARTAFPVGKEMLLTVIDGNQKQVHRDFHRSSSVTLEGLPFYDNLGDNYTVLAWADGYKQAGITPVKIGPRFNAIADLMLVPRDASFNFREARWDVLGVKRPQFARLLGFGSSDPAARDRYTQLMENKPAVLACVFNLFTVMEQVHLPERTPLDYLRELIWDRLAPDRLFAWAERKLVDQVLRAAEDKAFAPEPGAALFHPGASRSFKQVQFGEANLQLTFHESETRTVDGADCVLVEPDIDYYRDPLSHALLEVAVNSLTHSLTDAREVYVLRWMAGRHGGVPDFDPPYYLE